MTFLVNSFRFNEAGSGGLSDKWRVLVSSSGNNYGNVTLAELIFGPGSTPLPGSYSASSSYGAGYGAGNAFDSDPATLWSSANSGLPAWIRSDMVTSLDVNELTLAVRNDGYGEEQSPKVVDVQYSPDGVSWVTLWSIHGTAGWASSIVQQFRRQEDVAGLVSLLRMEGGFSDHTGKVWTPSGSVSVSTSQKVSGESSALFTGGHLNAPPGPDFNFGTGEFLWSGRIFVTDKSSNRVVFGVGNNRVLYIGGGSLYVYEPDSGSNILSGPPISTNTWYHVAVRRRGTTLELLVNGKTVSSTSYSKDLTSNNFRVGKSTNDTGAFAGYIDDVCILKGAWREN